MHRHTRDRDTVSLSHDLYFSPPSDLQKEIKIYILVWLHLLIFLFLLINFWNGKLINTERKTWNLQKLWNEYPFCWIVHSLHSDILAVSFPCVSDSWKFHSGIVIGLRYQSDEMPSIRAPVAKKTTTLTVSSLV